MPTYRRRWQAPSQRYRDHLRGARMFMWPEHKGLLDGHVNNARIADLEAFYELVMGEKAPKPRRYRPRPSRRV